MDSGIETRKPLENSHLKKSRAPRTDVVRFGRHHVTRRANSLPASRTI